MVITNAYLDYSEFTNIKTNTPVTFKFNIIFQNNFNSDIENSKP